VTVHEAVVALRAHYGRPVRPPTDPFELVVWENVAYLASPAKRREAFADLVRHVGTTPADIMNATRPSLRRVAAHGILADTFASKLRECGRIATVEFGGDLNAVVTWPLERAKKALQRFPGIGEPGAEKILLFTGKHALLAPDSNALRVLVRLGYIREARRYANMYAAARAVAAGLPARPRAMQDAHLLLQQHGQTLCKRTAPLCGKCPLAPGCAYFAARV
jgi:endonuclease-3